MSKTTTIPKYWTSVEGLTLSNVEMLRMIAGRPDATDEHLVDVALAMAAENASQDELTRTAATTPLASLGGPCQVSEWYEVDDDHDAPYRTANLGSMQCRDASFDGSATAPPSTPRRLMQGILHADVQVDVGHDGSTTAPVIAVDTESYPLNVTAAQARFIAAEFLRLADRLDEVQRALTPHAA